MKKIFLLFIILVMSLDLRPQGAGQWRKGEMEVKVYFSQASQADQLNKSGPNGDYYLHAGYALLYLTPPELDVVRETGLRYEILKADLEEFSRNFWNNRDQYHTYEAIILAMDSLSQAYPGICMKVSYGLSVEGRQLCALKISDNAASDEPEPEVMFDGGIHGDEIGGAENLIRFARFLCASYGQDPWITELIDSREIWLYIMINPDGRVNMVRQNSNGVDLNRDWGYMWDADGSSPEAYSQPETRALRTCMLDNQFVIHTSYHSGTEYLAYPWSYRPDSCPDKPHINYLAGIYSQVSGYASLPYGQGYSGMYPINGSSKDASYGIMGSVGWTMEISVDKQPPASQIPYFYDINKPAMLAVIGEAGFGISGTVTDALTGDPVAAMLFIHDYYPCYNDPLAGDYHKYLLAGSYSVTAVANGHQSQTLNAIINDSANTVLDFSLEPESGRYAYRVLACQVPGTNFADEAKTFAALGKPDGSAYSLGRNGWIMLDIQQEIADGPGNEITVYETAADPEGYACYAAFLMDGPWYMLGNGTGTASFDFAGTGITNARYIRINDDGDGDIYAPDAGFDLDAVEAPQQPQVIYLIIDAAISDSMGNDNGRIEPGEPFDLVITLQNAGSQLMENGQAYLNVNQDYLSADDPELFIGDLESGENVQFSFSMNCSSFCPVNEPLMTILNVVSNEGSYRQSFPVYFSAGRIFEDWETASLTKFDWETGGDKPWAINFSNPYEGTYTAKSGNIDDGEVSSLEVTFDVIGYDDISFYRRVSSEAGSDFLRFYIDNNLAGQWSGELGWEKVTCQVVPGFHTFKWAFEKDNQNSTGSDGGWIDYIVFPSCNLTGELKILANAIPHELCGPGQAQLGAYTTGGTASLTFSWTPSSGLNDSVAQFPTATLESTKQYQVTVWDGANNVNSTVQIVMLPVPQAPEIYQQGDSLISPVSGGNQWHDGNGPIEGATGRVFYPGAEGDYHVTVTNIEGCSSGPSNVIHFQFTSIPENNDLLSIKIYPNPFRNEIHIRLTEKSLTNIAVLLVDGMGRSIPVRLTKKLDLQEIIISPQKELKNGLFLISVYDDYGDLLISRKIIRN